MHGVEKHRSRLSDSHIHMYIKQWSIRYTAFPPETLLEPKKINQTCRSKG